MNAPATQQPIRARLLELDFALARAIEARDGETVRTIAEWQETAIQQALTESPDDRSWIREAADRLQNHLHNATQARDALRKELNGLDVQRKLMGAPVATNGQSRTGKNYLA